MDEGGAWSEGGEGGRGWKGGGRDEDNVGDIDEQYVQHRGRYQGQQQRGAVEARADKQAPQLQQCTVLYAELQVESGAAATHLGAKGKMHHSDDSSSG